MRYIASLILASAISCHAFGFSAVAWHAKLARLDEDAERLKKAYAECVAAVAGISPAQDVSVPIECHPDGSVKVKISAAKAQMFFDTGYVWAEDVKIVEYAPGGVDEVASVTAKSCVVDRNRKSGYVEGAAKAVFSKTTVEGVGIYFSFAEEFVKIISDVRITSSDLKMEGIKL